MAEKGLFYRLFSAVAKHHLFNNIWRIRCKSKRVNTEKSGALAGKNKMSNQTGAAIGAISTHVNWERKDLDLQAIIEAGNQGKLDKPLTDWLAAKGWMGEVVYPKDIVQFLDPLVHVDRSTKLIFPDWVKKVMHPEMQDLGPTEFDVTKLEQWLHEEQKTGRVTGTKIYEHHKKEKMLENDFGLQELLAIQSRGINFFRTHFKDKYPMGWKSVVRRSDGSLRVPCLYGHTGRVVLSWPWIDYDFDADDPALRFASSINPQNSESLVSSDPKY